MVLSDIDHPNCFKRKQQSLYLWESQQRIFPKYKGMEEEN